MDNQKKKGPESLGDLLQSFDWDRDKYISVEFQKYGYDLAEELGDPGHKALYIKMAKEYPREMLDKARNFVKDASKVKSKARLFMWKLQQLKKEQKNK